MHWPRGAVGGHEPFCAAYTPPPSASCCSIAIEPFEPEAGRNRFLIVCLPFGWRPIELVVPGLTFGHLRLTQIDLPSGVLWEARFRVLASPPGAVRGHWNVVPER